MNWYAIAGVGLGVGFLAGMFGKGGSAVATPLLHAAGVPAIVALAAPLPATIPSTIAASAPYWRSRLVDRHVLAVSLVVGLPATAVGALLTRWVSGEVLVEITDVVIAVLGVRFLLAPDSGGGPGAGAAPERRRVIAVAVIVGLASGLLANSGGFLLAPLYMVVLRIPIRGAFATSLAVATFLAVPGTLVHWALGHVDWHVVAVFGITSVPFSYVGALVALRVSARRLERVYGGVLLTLGVVFLLHR